MRYPSFILIVAGIVGLTTSAFATVTLQFSQTNVARATGFADSNGTPTNGMLWGIVVDASGNGFSPGDYTVFDNTTNGFLSNSLGLTDDYFITTGLLTSTQAATADDPGGVGGITSLANVFSSYPTGIGAGDAFQLIWFESTPGDGSFYGMHAHPSFTLPSDGSTQSYAAAFSGPTADPAKPASYQFDAIPEPSRLMLLGMGVIGLIFRRRR